MQTDVDVVIIGAGFAGAATAFHLARRGRTDVLIVEREPLAGVHSSGRHAGIVREYVGEPALQSIVSAGAAMLRSGELAAYERRGIMLMNQGDEDVSRHFPPARGRGDWRPDDGTIDAGGLLSAYLAGRNVAFNTEVAGWEERNGRMVVRTSPPSPPGRGAGGEGALLPSPPGRGAGGEGALLPSPPGRGAGGEGALLPSPPGRGAGGEGALLPSPPGRGAGGEGALLPSPPGRGAGGEGALLPSPPGRGAGGEGALLPSPPGRGAGGEGRRIACNVLVNAAGPWAGEVGRLPLQPTNRHLFVTTPLPWVDPSWPTVWDGPAGLYFRPESGGLLLCACDETPARPGEYDEDQEVLADLSHKLAAMQPGLGELAVQQSWVGQRTFAPDRRFVIGFDPRFPRLFHVAGLGGHGVTSSYEVGRIAAALIDGDSTAAAAAPALRPDRLTMGEIS